MSTNAPKMNNDYSFETWLVDMLSSDGFSLAIILLVLLVLLLTLLI